MRRFIPGMTNRYLVEITTKGGYFRTLYNTINEFYETREECNDEIDRVIKELPEGWQFFSAKIYDTYNRNEIVGLRGLDRAVRLVRPGVWRHGIRYK